MSGKDGKRSDKNKESDVSKDWAEIDDDGSVETLDESEPLTVIARPSVFEHLDGTAHTEGEVDPPEPDREEERKERAKRRQEADENARSGGRCEGGQAVLGGTAPAGDQQKKKGKKTGPEEHGKPGLSNK